MKIFLVTDGEYSGFRVMGAFSTKKAAENFRAFHLYNENIEEYELDPLTPKFDPDNRMWRCTYEQGRMWSDESGGDTTPVRKLLYVTHMGGTTYSLRYNVQAPDEQSAMKIFQEKVRAWLAGATAAYSRDDSEVFFIAGKAVPVAIANFIWEGGYVLGDGRTFATTHMTKNSSSEYPMFRSGENPTLFVRLMANNQSEARKMMEAIGESFAMGSLVAWTHSNTGKLVPVRWQDGRAMVIEN